MTIKLSESSREAAERAIDRIKRLPFRFWTKGGETYEFLLDTERELESKQPRHIGVKFTRDVRDVQTYLCEIYYYLEYFSYGGIPHDSIIFDIPKKTYQEIASTYERFQQEAKEAEQAKFRKIFSELESIVNNLIGEENDKRT